MNDWGTRARARIVGTFAIGVGLLVSTEAHAEWSSVSLGGTTVEVYAPQALSPVGDGRALMVVLHGCAQTSTALRDAGNLEPAADSMGVVMAVPAVPNGGVLAGCWDYYGALHSRSSPHIASVLDMVDGLLADPALDIDANQVYVIGLSSGGGESMVIGCVAPDVFAGVGVVAGPAVGTGMTEITSVSTTPEQAATVCRQLAGGNASALTSQAGLTFADALDYTVAQGYNAVNAGMFAEVMSEGIANMEASTVDFADLPGTMPMGTVTEYADASGVRVAQLDSMSNTGHAWPSGDGEVGGGLSFVNGNGLDMAQYAAEFFAAYNPRADGWDPMDPDGGTGSGGGDDTDGGDSQGGTDGGDSQGGTDGGDSQGDGDGDGDGSGNGSGPNSGDGSGTSDTDTDGAAQDGDGGGCTVAGSGGGTWAWALGLLVLAGRRRRLRSGR